MSHAVKITILVLVLAGFAVALALNLQRAPHAGPGAGPLAGPLAATGGSVTVTVASPAGPSASAQVTTVSLPRLVDVGAGKCIPCKLMAPILAELRQEYAGRLRVDFVDVWLDPAAAEPYGVSAIPTQIFYSAEGKELARHEGFLGKADILAQWQALGVNLAPPSAVPPLSVPPISTMAAGASAAAAGPGVRPCCGQ